jgi:hypothetical protein
VRETHIENMGKGGEKNKVQMKNIEWKGKRVVTSGSPLLLADAVPRHPGGTSGFEHPGRRSAGEAAAAAGGGAAGSAGQGRAEALDPALAAQVGFGRRHQGKAFNQYI